jgi:hypothetical protein
MATKYLERIVSGASYLVNQLKSDSAGNVAPIVMDADDDLLKYYDRTNDVARVIVNTDEAQTLSNKNVGMAVNTPVTAFAGGGQAGATQLVAGINVVTVVATAADSVKLPLAVLGQSVVVINTSANAVQVFGAGTDTINGIASATGISQAAGTTKTYVASKSAPAGAWFISADAAVAGSGFSLAPVTEAGATPTVIDPDLSATYVATLGSAVAFTLAAPADPASDGVTIVVTSNTAFAHTITTATLLDTGTASTTSIVFDAFAGASVILMAFAGRWKIIGGNKFTLT